jgi:secreted trypsin-like serine protease
VLMEASMAGVARSTCATYWQGTTVGKSTLCATHLPQNSNPATSFCQVDSGGPLTDQEGVTLLGVASFGSSSCDTSTQPNVFGNVFNVRGWIEEHLA